MIKSNKHRPITLKLKHINLHLTSSIYLKKNEGKKCLSIYSYFISINRDSLYFFFFTIIAQRSFRGVSVVETRFRLKGVNIKRRLATLIIASVRWIGRLSPKGKGFEREKERCENPSSLVAINQKKKENRETCVFSFFFHFRQ